MRMVAVFGIAAAMLAIGSGSSRADTCYETAQVNIECSAKGGGGATGKPAPSPSKLRELLRQSLSRGGTARSTGCVLVACSAGVFALSAQSHPAQSGHSPDDSEGRRVWMPARGDTAYSDRVLSGDSGPGGVSVLGSHVPLWLASLA